MKRFLLLAQLATLLAGCGIEGLAEVGFVLVRAHTARGGSVLDRTHVVLASCEVFSQISGENFSRTVTVSSGSMQVIMDGIPAGSGYFARLKGLDASNAIYECGASGPFSLVAGEKRLVTLVIDRPPPGNESCERVCTSDADCSAGEICPSPCAQGTGSEDCTQALCHRS